MIYDPVFWAQLMIHELNEKVHFKNMKCLKKI